MAAVPLPTRIVERHRDGAGVLLVSAGEDSRPPAEAGRIVGLDLDRLAGIADAGFALAPAAVDSPFAYLALVRLPEASAGERLAELRRRATRVASALPGGALGLTVEAPPASADRDAVVEMLIEGALAATARRDAVSFEEIVVIGDEALAPSLRRAGAIGAASAWARGLVDEPSSDLGPAELAARAVAAAEAQDVAVRCWSPEDLAAEGFAGLLAVARGSAAPTMVDLHHRTDEDLPLVVLVGKAITFDSGGMQTKQARMEWNKADMAGGAAVLAAALAAVELDLPVALRVLVPCAENLGGPGALRPGDVIRHRDGRTSEVRNTDGEGRLVLADAISYAAQLESRMIVDVATLTNPYGSRISGYATNDDSLAVQLASAAVAAGEPSWRLPLHHGYLDELASNVADLANYVPIPSAANDHAGIRAMTAALFLEPFAAGRRWAHVDIAATAYNLLPADGLPAGATGSPISTLVRLLSSASSTSPR